MPAARMGCLPWGPPYYGPGCLVPHWFLGALGVCHSKSAAVVGFNPFRLLWKNTIKWVTSGILQNLSLTFLKGTPAGLVSAEGPLPYRWHLLVVSSHGGRGWIALYYKALESSLIICGRLVLSPSKYTKIRGCSSPLYKMAHYFHIAYAHPPKHSKSSLNYL